MTTDDAMDRMDTWVRSRGNGRWVDPEAQDVTTPIQQVRTEVAELVDVLLELSPRQRCLEVGLGEFGGTHVLWRMLFEEVVCVERDAGFVDEFAKRENLPEWDSQSHIITSDSLSKRAVRLALERGPYDFLHIDGNHDHWAVRSDWCNYSPMVRPGGLVALHDLLTPGVSRLAEELSKTHKVRRVVHSKHVGTMLVEV